MRTKTINRKYKDILHILYVLLVVIAINVVGYYMYARFDLTAEKRYSLSSATKQMLKELDEYVYFKVYLEGDFPAGFKRLSQATQEMLDEFRAYSPYVEYKFINPSESADEAQREAVYQQLIEKGLQPTTINLKNNDGKQQQLIFPGALVTAAEEEIALDLLKNQMQKSPEQVLNSSVENLEYALASAIQKLSQQKRPSIGVIQGHGELNAKEMGDLGHTLSQDYNVHVVHMKDSLSSLLKYEQYQEAEKLLVSKKYDMIIVAKPQSAFSEKDKFVIDQFVMRGGKVLWLIDPVYATMDSLQKATTTLAYPLELNLEDMFFKYGVRINKDLLMDLNARPIPMVTGMVGNTPKQSFVPWYYFPIIAPQSKHPMVNNLNAIMTTFPSTIDTVRAVDLKKTALLQSSPYSRVSRAPVLVDLNMAHVEPEASLFNQPSKMVAVLVEGKFKSLFANRIPPRLANNDSIRFVQESAENAMLFIADGDIARNQLHYSKGYVLPLGYDQFTQQSFGNKDFLLNAVSYLLDTDGLISIRSREIKLRLLDKSRMNANMFTIKLLNVLLPLLVVAVMALVIFWYRRRKYLVKK